VVCLGFDAWIHGPRLCMIFPCDDQINSPSPSRHPHATLLSGYTHLDNLYRFSLPYICESAMVLASDFLSVAHCFLFTASDLRQSEAHLLRSIAANCRLKNTGKTPHHLLERQ